MAFVIRRAASRPIAASAVAALLAACSGGGPPSTLVPGSSNVNAQVRSNMQAANGRAPISTNAVQAAVRGRLSGDATTGSGLIYSGSYNNNAIYIFKNKGINPPVAGTITTGLSNPERLFVDRHLNLWASNIGNNTVVAYPPGATAPSFTITAGVNSPTGLTVGANGSVYVANVGDDTVKVYHRGKKTPALTISLGNASPENVAVDSVNNVYIQYIGGTRGSGVLKVPAGQTSGTDLNLVIGEANALTVDKAENVVIIDGAVPAVDVFPPGATSPSKSIPITDGSPFELSMNKAETKIFTSVEAGLSFYVEQASYPGGTKFTDKITQNAGDWPLAVAPDNVL